jgi:hypothetical protein
LFVVLGLITSAARAANGAAEARFAEARTAFDAGNYSQALQLFEQCVDLGMQGPAIYYNIGVAAYRSGDYPRAERAFREVARTPAMAPLADYNLGLVAVKRSDPKTAREWFQRASTGATDDKLRALAAQRLAELPATPAESPWSYYARAGLGHDDNVALRAESVNTPGTGKADSFAELLAAGSYSFLPSWRIDGAAGLMRYSKLDDFDQTAWSLGVARGFSFDTWYLELGGYGTQLTLGGDVYERSAAVNALASKQFRGHGTLQGQMRLSSVNGAGDFSGLTGTRTELGAQYEWAWRSLTLAAHARAEFNDSADETFASRWTELGGEARWALSPWWSFSAAARQRHTTHPEVPATQAGFDDRRTTLRLEATRTLWKQVQLYVRYEHEHSQSDVALYDYNRDWIAASIETWR